MSEELKRKHSNKVERLRQKKVEINGAFYVPAKWVKRILLPLELKRFLKLYKWRKLHARCVCNTCGHQHLNEKKFKRYAYFWDLQSYIDGG